MKTLSTHSPVLSQKQLSDTHAKFHILFLFLVAAMFFLSILCLFSYHLWLIGQNRTTNGNLATPHNRTTNANLATPRATTGRHL